MTITVEEDGVIVTPDEFRLDPGEERTLDVTGVARGLVSARMESLTTADGGDTSGVTLEVAFPRPAQDQAPTVVIVASIIGALVLSVALRRYRPWGVARHEGRAMTANPNMREAIARARRLGIVVDTVRRTGEVRFEFPDGGTPITANNRRKDAPKELVKRIKRYESSERRDQR